MNKKRRNIILYFITLVTLFVGAFWYGKYERKRIAYIEANGVETVGLIVRRGAGSRSRGANYHVHFEFEHNGQKITAYQSFYNNRDLYEHAIVGMKYKVKYLADSPKKNALIYVYEPILSEYANIERERERIFKTNKKAKNNARDLEDIKYLIPANVIERQ